MLGELTYLVLLSFPLPWGEGGARERSEWEDEGVRGVRLIRIDRKPSPSRIALLAVRPSRREQQCQPEGRVGRDDRLNPVAPGPYDMKSGVGYQCAGATTLP